MTQKKALEYLKSLNIVISWDWREQLEIVKRHAFTVAKIYSADVLQEILNALIQAVDEGDSFKDFKENLTGMLEEKGYSHAKGTGYKLENIYRTNLQTAFMKGRYEQMKDTTDLFPYWRYIAVMDMRTRPHHAAMHGKIFRADDPIWLTWYPPNGFNCFPGDTLIATPDGWTRIDELKIGQRIIGGSGEERLVRFIHHNRFNGHFVRITIEKGISLLATPNHRILTLRGWISARNLTTDDVIVNIGKITTSRLDVEMIEQSNDSVAAHVPSLDQLSGSEFLSNIEVEEGFSSGSPLDRFDSLDSFVIYARTHLSLSQIVDISFTNIHNDTDIYNLDVDVDESYVTQIGIVHNCRCRVQPVDDQWIEKKKAKINIGTEVSDPPDTGFARSPVEPIEPNYEKYSQPISDSLRQQVADRLEESLKLKVETNQ